MLIDEDDDTTPISQLLAQKSKKGKEAVPNDKGEISQGESSGGEGSDYGIQEFNEEVRSKRKERKENRKRSITKNKKLPKPGDKNVSAEAFAKLDGGNSDDDSVTENLQSPSVKQHPAVAKLGRGRQHKPFSPSGNQTAII